jgi:hypothetical protein
LERIEYHARQPSGRFVECQFSTPTATSQNALERQAPHEIGRAQFDRISIANMDSEATPLMDAAFDAAWRAVEEQTA